MVRPKKKSGGTDSQESSEAFRHRRTREAHAREIAEDYVEVIASMIAERGEARVSDIARRLGVSHVTVVKKVNRLVRDGLVTTLPYRSLFLTKKGSLVARQSKRRHEIVKTFLVSIGVSEKVANLDAEGIEHHVSEETVTVFEEHSKRGKGQR